jgi:hypothetical protein
MILGGLPTNPLPFWALEERAQSGMPTPRAASLVLAKRASRSTDPWRVTAAIRRGTKRLRPLRKRRVLVSKRDVLQVVVELGRASRGTRARDLQTNS